MATLYWPFPTSTVSEWPGQRAGSYHVGTDFAIPQGTPLKATIDGVITRHNTDGLGAYVLDIISDDGLLVRNGHLSRMDVQTGQRVTAGQVIGLTGGARGTTGAGNSFGPHLHWELRRDRKWSDGAWIDPRTLNPQPSTFGATPAPPKPKDGEAEMIIVLHWNRDRAYAMGQQFLHAYKWKNYGEAVAKSINPDRKFIELKDENATSDAFMWAYGIPLNVWQSLEPGQTWSAVQNTSGSVASIDPAVIAKAVNDDAAKRMQS